MTKLDALESCVGKWKDICDDKRDIQLARTQCSLCALYIIGNCDGCPLSNIDECCLDGFTLWSRIESGVKSLISDRSMYLSEVNNPELTALCHKMRDLLIRLRDEEKELKCVQKTK